MATDAPSQDHASYAQLPPAAAAQCFQVEPAHGLTMTQVADRLELYGPNNLGEPETRAGFDILIDQFRSLLALLLTGAAVLSFLFEDMAEGIAILVVLAINAAIGFWAEMKAETSMAALRQMGRTTSRVRREGRVNQIPADDLVPGDILLLEAGDIVTADVRLLESARLQCDESLLTGESVPVDKDATPGRAGTAEAATLAFKGTAITRGHATGLVLATGRSTRLGEIATLADTAVANVSPLERRLAKLSEQLLLVVLGLMVVLAAGGILAGYNMLVMVKTAIALAVAAIPEGLPIVATLALARGMWKLAARNALIERLSAVETLGSVTVILTDKTGTLTENRMTVSELLAPDGTDPARLLRVAALCHSGGEPDQMADPMERALVTAAQKAGQDKATCEARHPRLGDEAFDPHVRMMATIHADGSHYLFAVKGAPEAVLAAATRIAAPGGDQPLTDDARVRWLEKAQGLAAQGLRLIAIADKTAASAADKPYDGLTFLGLVGLEDPLRADAAAAVRAAQGAGVRVVMATGDSAATAGAIAAEAGIHQAGGTVIEGSAFTGAALPADDILATGVFARMSPKEKLKLIELHQKAGAVVAMTGDGVNDAPALRQADVGIAMGLRGTEVAKEAAAMILKDDAFASIVAAIQQGRVIYANIRTFVIYLMSCNLSEVLVVTLCLLAGLPLPLLPLQILFLNLVTDVFPALALGFGRGDRDILMRPPRPTGESMLQRRHWLAITAYAALMTASVTAAFAWASARAGMVPDYAGTVAFLSLAFGQLWHVFNMRSRRTPLFNNGIVRNPFIWVAEGLCLLLLAAAMKVPALAAVLYLAPLDGAGWAVVLGASLIPLVLAQAAKSAFRK
ncbi:MAG: cation-transporting P-type ATPase [Alphaproteobacteria bacterium]|nr:MAG: cation-transporting P-type ATPase [Alphaproteobacteria bacterium]